MNEIVKAETGNSSAVPAVVVQREPTPMDLMERAIALGPQGVEMLKELTALKLQLEDRAAKTEYIAAMAKLAPLLPVVDRNGHVKYEGKDGKPGMNRKYGKYEDIDEAIRPLYSAEGFSVSWKTEEGQGGKIRMVGECSHRQGHSKEFKIDLPHYSMGGKNAILAIASTVLGYGRRILTTMIFNVRVAGQDTDGENPTPITEEQCRDLNTALIDTKSDLGRFLKHFGIEKLADLTQGQLTEALQMIEGKRSKKL